MKWRCYNRYLTFEIERNFDQMRFMGSSTSKIRLRPGLRPDPRWGSLLRSPDPLAGGEGARWRGPPPQEPNSRTV